MGLRLKTPPKKEPVSLKEAKAYLRVDTSTEDGLIEHLIKASRQAIEAYTNRCLLEQTWSFEINAGYAAARSDDLYLDASKSKGMLGIEIPRSPFLKLEGDPVLCDGENSKSLKDYKLDTVGPVARIHFGHSLLNDQGFVRITFKAGYGEEATSVPAPLKQAALMLVGTAYENRTSALDTKDHPLFMGDDVIRILTPYRIMRLG